jgi:hypothetical protein
MGIFIGLGGVVVVLVGAVIYFATRSPAPVEVPPAQPPMVAQAPATPPKQELPMPPPPAGMAQNPAGTQAAAAGTQEPAVQPAAAPATATPAAQPAVAASPTPPAPAPAAEPAKPAELPKEAVARADPPDPRGSSRPQRTGSSGRTVERSSSSDESAGSSRSSRRPSPAEESDDEFDELFGPKKGGGSKPEQPASNSGRSAYIPPEPGGGNVPARLGQSDIMQVVLANKPAIVKCVSEQKKKNPSLSGKLVMRWSIQTNGRTKNISCQTAEFRSTYMAGCISGLIKNWTFPKHKVEGQPIDFPFTF